MRLRADPGLAAAAFALDVEAAALRASLEEGGGDDSVATVGLLSLKPGAVNSVPREASMTVDARDVSGARRDRMLARIREAARQRARERPGVSVEVEVASEDAPASADARVVAATARAAAEVTGAEATTAAAGAGTGETPSLLSPLFSFFKPRPPRPPPLVFLPSRAYHDALLVSRVAPAGMLFVRCLNGWSHRPDEFASASDLELGVKALALALAELAGDAGAAAEAAEEGQGGAGGRCPEGRTGAVGRVT
jgi:ureidoglycolate amidohydrolase